MSQLIKPEQATTQKLATQLNAAFKKSGLSSKHFFNVICMRPSVEYSEIHSNYMVIEAWVEGWILRFEYLPESDNPTWLCEPSPNFCVGV